MEEVSTVIDRVLAAVTARMAVREHETGPGRLVDRGILEAPVLADGRIDNGSGKNEGISGHHERKQFVGGGVIGMAEQQPLKSLTMHSGDRDWCGRMVHLHWRVQMVSTTPNITDDVAKTSVPELLAQPADRDRDGVLGIVGLLIAMHGVDQLIDWHDMSRSKRGDYREFILSQRDPSIPLDQYLLPDIQSHRSGRLTLAGSDDDCDAHGAAVAAEEPIATLAHQEMLDRAAATSGEAGSGVGADIVSLQLEPLSPFLAGGSICVGHQNNHSTAAGRIASVTTKRLASGDNADRSTVCAQKDAPDTRVCK